MSTIAWEVLKDNLGGELHRLAVPDGWLVKYISPIGGPAHNPIVTFYPDYSHSWQISDTEETAVNSKIEDLPF